MRRRWSGVAIMAIAVVAVMIGIGAGLGATPAAAQEVALSNRGPRFLMAATPASPATPIDVRRSAMLRRQLSLDLNGVTIADALAEVTRQTGVAFVYSRDELATEARVHLRAAQITIAAALTEILLDTGVDVLFSSPKQAALVRRMESEVVQTGSVVGRVTDTKTGDGLAGAEVFLEGTRWRASTGPDGRYRLAEVAPESYTLTVRRPGYGKQSRAVTVVSEQEVTADVALQPVATQLDEIVTTVTGDQRRVELGHVVGRINADSVVKEASVSNLSELLNGRVPGLQVFQGQGTIGGEVRLQIRGPNSLELNSEPIVIIDGVRYTSEAVQRTLAVGPAVLVEPTGPLNDLNPNDIETIEVVKGPSAATLYGTDAANGVLVITTKRGRAGPARWNVYARGTRNEIPTERFPDLYWGWGTVNGVPNNPAFSCTLPRLASRQCTRQDSVAVLPNPLNDPELTLFAGKPSWQYGANVAGGQQDIRYYFSGDFEDATGPVQMPPEIAERLKQQRGLSELPEEWREPNALTKLNLRSNITAVPGETADLRVNVGYVHSAARSLGNTPYNTGSLRGTPTTAYGTLGRQNPADKFVQTSTERTDRFFGSADAQWRPVPWLATRATVGVDLGSRNRYSLARRGDAPGDPSSRNGAVQDDRVRQLATTAELGATATARRGRLSARTAVGAQYVRTLNDALSSAGTDLPPGGTSVGEAASVQSRQTYAETVTLGSYFEETLGLNDRLFVTGALRVDGASTFGRDYNATVYPKASASWLLSDEPFLPRLPGLDELRLRYAYGASGQQPRPEWARPSFATDRVVENGVATTVMRLVGPGNPALRPERVREHELGFDATALAGRLRLGLTWYRRRTADQILVQLLPPGADAIRTNLGLTTQRGFEAELTARLVDARYLSWDVTLQHGVHRTKLVDLGGAFALRDIAGGYVEGYPLGARFQRQVAGYTDANGDGIITFDEVQLGDTAVYVGESTPPRSQTLTTVMSLFERRLRLSALLERRSGFTQVNELRTIQCRGSLCREAVDPGTPPEEQAQIQALPSTERLPLEPGDFTRLREVTAALDLPLGLARALRVRSAAIAVSVRNLALWTKFSGPDPESAARDSFVSPVSGGVAAGIPQGRSWTLRLDLGL